MKSIDIVVMVILGGMGRTAGVICAAVLLTLLPEVLRGFADYRMIIYSLLIIVMMMVRPQGLFTFRRPFKAEDERRFDNRFVRIDGDHAHAKGVGAAGDLRADAAEADDQHRLAVQLLRLQLGLEPLPRISRAGSVAARLLRQAARET